MSLVAPDGRRLDAIFFDFDGVILESADVKTEAFWDLFADRPDDQRQRVLDHHLQNVGRTRYAKFAWAYEHVFDQPYDDAEERRMDEAFTALVESRLMAVPPVPGAMELLDLASREHSCFVVSASPRRDLERTISERGIAHHFREIRGAPGEKSVHVAELIAAHGVDVSRSLLIGDATADLDAATASSLTFIGRVRPGTRDPFPAGTYVVDDLRALVRLLSS